MDGLTRRRQSSQELCGWKINSHKDIKQIYLRPFGKQNGLTRTA